MAYPISVRGSQVASSGNTLRMTMATTMHIMNGNAPRRIVGKAFQIEPGAQRPVLLNVAHMNLEAGVGRDVGVMDNPVLILIAVDIGTCCSNGSDEDDGH
jgi:hypothetical protein